MWLGKKDREELEELYVVMRCCDVVLLLTVFQVILFLFISTTEHNKSTY